jgi:DNA-binding NtrC family response regulator
MVMNNVSSKNNGQEISTHTGEEYSKRILIFSTDNDFCRSLTMLFQSKYQVVSATSIEELQMKMSKEKVDLLLTDSTKSDKDIFLVVKNIKSTYPHLFIVLLYVYKYSDVEQEKQFRQYVDAILYKPVDASKLMDIMDDLLTSKNKKYD